MVNQTLSPMYHALTMCKLFTRIVSFPGSGRMQPVLCAGTFIDPHDKGVKAFIDEIGAMWRYSYDCLSCLFVLYGSHAVTAVCITCHFYGIFWSCMDKRL